MFIFIFAFCVYLGFDNLFEKQLLCCYNIPGAAFYADFKE